METQQNLNLDRQITTDLFEVLDILYAAEDYGYAKSVLISFLFKLVGKISEEEIEAFAQTFLTEEMRKKGYGEEDYEIIKERLTNYANHYNKYQ